MRCTTLNSSRYVGTVASHEASKAQLISNIHELQDTVQEHPPAFLAGCELDRAARLRGEGDRCPGPGELARLANAIAAAERLCVRRMNEGTSSSLSTPLRWIGLSEPRHRLLHAYYCLYPSADVYSSRNRVADRPSADCNQGGGVSHCARRDLWEMRCYVSTLWECMHVGGRMLSPHLGGRMCLCRAASASCRSSWHLVRSSRTCSLSRSTSSWQHQCNS